MVWRCGRTAVGPELSVVAVAPGRLAVTTLGDTLMIARGQRPAGRRRDGAAGARNFKIQLTLRDDAAYRGVAGQTLHGLRRNSRSTLEFTCRGARDAGQRLDGCPDDELRPRTGAVGVLARRSLLAKLEQGIGPDAVPPYGRRPFRVS